MSAPAKAPSSPSQPTASIAPPKAKPETTTKKEGEKKKYPGRHKFRVNACEFDVDRKYFPVKVLGEGAYGVVCLAEDREDNKNRVAIKKCTKIIQDLVDAKRILREIKLLRHFNHPQVVGIKDLIPPRSLGYIEDVYIVMDSMEANLHKIIYSRQRLSNEHIQYFLYQILKGMKYLHSAGVLHRDLKPSNLLVNHNCDLKICDFGLARSINVEKEDPQFTEYVVTRHYRAPEVMTNAKKYGVEIDVWSCGCIFAELLGRKALFPGQDYLEQLRLIISKVGSPTKEDLDAIPTPAARSYIEGLGAQKKTVWKDLFTGATPQALDLLDKMLQFNPKKRITVDEALKHEYFKGFTTKGDVPAECKTQVKWDWDTDLDEAKIQDLMWDEIYQFRPFLKEEREKRLKDGTLLPPDFASIRAQHQADRKKEKAEKEKDKTEKDKDKDKGKKDKEKEKEKGVITAPIDDE